MKLFNIFVLLSTGLFAKQCFGLLCYVCNSTHPACDDPFDSVQSQGFIMQCTHLVHESTCEKTIHYLDDGTEHIVRGCGWVSPTDRQCLEHKSRPCFKIAEDSTLQHYEMEVFWPLV